MKPIESSILNHTLTWEHIDSSSLLILKRESLVQLVFIMVSMIGALDKNTGVIVCGKGARAVTGLAVVSDKKADVKTGMRYGWQSISFFRVGVKVCKMCEK